MLGAGSTFLNNSSEIFVGLTEIADTLRFFNVAQSQSAIHKPTNSNED
jgi:hypothetical protein